MVDKNELAAVLDSMLEGLQILGRDWRYLHVNEVAAAHGRTTKERLIGRTLQECYPGIERTDVFAAMEQCMVERRPCVMETEFTFPDGSKGWFEVRIAPVPQGICVLSIDVTARKTAEAERRRAEERLQHAQRMEAIGLLASGIAHDFNNLLTVVMSQAELALLRPGGPARSDIDTIVVAARSASALTRQLLAYGRRSVLRREIVELREVVEGIETILRRSMRDDIELVFDLDRDVGRVDVDRVHLEQIVLNLVVNARDAIEGAGSIRIALERVDHDSDYVRRHPEARTGPHAVLVVADSGAGMDAATQARIFEPFFTTKDRLGSGLGLATVYGIVQQHGGSIGVKSSPGAGTTFAIHLPIAAAPAPAAAAPGSEDPAASAPPSTLLVVDDQREIANLIRLMLTGDAHTVLVAHSGDEGLAVWRERHDSIDAMITDFGMPGMSGGDLIAAVRADRPDLPIVCTSAHPDPSFTERWEEHGGVLFLEKPFTRHQLRSAVARALEARRRAQ